MDEAGFTGDNLMSDDQEYFVLSSIELSDNESQKILDSIQKYLKANNVQFKELKGKNLTKHKKGLQLVCDLLTSLDHKTLMYEKKFVLVAKYIDWLYEELLNHQIFYGENFCSLLHYYVYNLVKDNKQILVNMETVLREKSLTPVFTKQLATSNSFIARLVAFEEQNKQSIQETLTGMPDWNLELSSTALNMLGNLYGGTSNIICDNSKPLYSQAEDLEKFVKRKISFVDSKDVAGIQITDLLSSGTFFLLKTHQGGDILQKVFKSADFQMIFIKGIMKKFPQEKFEGQFNRLFP